MTKDKKKSKKEKLFELTEEELESLAAGTGTALRDMIKKIKKTKKDSIKFKPKDGHKY